MISGEIISAQSTSLTLLIGGSFGVEVLVPPAIIAAMPSLSQGAEVTLVTHFYLQIDQSKGVPVMIGFLTENQRDFFEDLLQVLGPKTAVKAISEPISSIARAIENGDISYLIGLSGVGRQKAKDIVAKLQGKMIRYISEEDIAGNRFVSATNVEADNSFSDVMAILQQLQYSKSDAESMIRRVIAANPELKTTEEILDAIYKKHN